MRFYFTLIFCFCFFTLIFSQNKKLSGGIYFGPALSNIKGTEIIIQGLEPFLSLNAGAFANYRFKNHYCAISDLEFASKGGAYPVTANGELEVRKFNTISSHLLLQLRTEKKDFFFLNLGVFGSKIGKAFLVVTETQPYKKQEEELIRVYSLFDFGISGGTGICSSLTQKINIILEMRYDYGIMNINRFSPTNNGTIFSRQLSLKAGIVF